MSMATNAGTKQLDLQGTVRGFGKVWFDPKQLANIYGFSHLADQFRIVYDSAVEDAFTVFVNGHPIKFERTTDGLYAYKPQFGSDSESSTSFT